MRVEGQPAFILHSRPYRETSLLIECLTRDHGRIGLVARGVRRERTRVSRASLQPLTPVQLGWSGRGELATLSQVESVAASFDPRIRSVSDPAAVAALLAAFRARAEKRPVPSGGDYAMDHTAIVYVLNPAQQVLAVLPEATPTATLVGDLVAALRKDPGFAPRGGP